MNPHIPEEYGGAGASVDLGMWARQRGVAMDRA